MAVGGLGCTLTVRVAGTAVGEVRLNLIDRIEHRHRGSYTAVQLYVRTMVVRCTTVDAFMCTVQLQTVTRRHSTAVRYDL